MVLEWDEALGKMIDPLGRAVKAVHKNGVINNTDAEMLTQLWRTIKKNKSEFSGKKCFYENFVYLPEEIYFCAVIRYEMKHEEQQIIRRLKEGDSKAYQYLYDMYYTLLCAVACEYLGDRFLSENIVDELIVHLWEKRETLEISVSLQSYLIRAVRNRCINALQRERERREISFSVMNADEYETILSSEYGDYPLAVLLENELEGKIRQAIENLPPDSRRIFKMSRFENKPYGQIAEESGISVSTVKYHVKNALARLKDELQKYLQER